MHHMLQDLLDMSRLGRVVSPPETVSLIALVREVAKGMRAPLADRGVHVVRL